MKETSLCKNCNESWYNYALKEGVCIKCREKQKKAEKGFKLCPYCGEKIKYIAIKCRYCNEMLDKSVDANGDTSIDKNDKQNEKESVYKKPTRIKEVYNKLSITGFIFSLISIFGFGLFGIIGLLLGIVSLTKISKTTDKGKGLAISAIVIGFIWGIAVNILKRLFEMGY